MSFANRIDEHSIDGKVVAQVRWPATIDGDIVEMHLPPRARTRLVEKSRRKLTPTERAQWFAAIDRT